MKPWARTSLIALSLAVLGCVSPMMASSASAAVARDGAAEAYVGEGAHQVLGVLNAHETDVSRRQAFRTLIDRFADVPKITRFVLGKYARTISPADYQRFAIVFRRYADSIYQTRINEYHGENVTVTGSLVRKPGDTLVTTEISGGQVRQPARVIWRVLGVPGSFKVVDVQVSGIWLAITQQQDFVSTLDNAGGNINVLINQLVQDTNGAIHGKH